MGAFFNSNPGPLRTYIGTSTITYGSEVGSGVSVGILGLVGGEAVVAVAVHRIGLRVTQADTVVATTRRINKKHFFIVENLKPLTAALLMLNSLWMVATICTRHGGRVHTRIGKPSL
jgi:hypothetical protein